ncbi:CHAT domain-containing protein [Comamonas sp. JC664]|uniref:CHAT domain-containing tetratricopeptide repeat protein n=1 Tax=Comamonas sp. JC664 TaxID=2801917 RepID=UPI00174D6F0B|nr:CHAT domain-containing protein [Comamonas sp. JC664]MBL0696369.1 CHAT domain-containing protein [Comamonas sp. JC664]GHG83933.1 hypothetical protein GCM10012319_38910 [Comamonas sp. KCTC 72670]
MESFSKFSEEIKYSVDLESTAWGRRSSQLRQQAFRHKQEGRLAAAHEVFLEAARLHPDDDPSTAAAGAWHDLAKSFMDLSGRLPEERYLQAEHLLRRAAQSPGRRKYPGRLAVTLTMLASCLRYRADALPRGNAAEALLDEAVLHSNEAVRLTEGLGPSGRPGCIDALYNLGNLHEQRRDWEEAIHAYDKALTLQQAVSVATGAKPDYSVRLELSKVLPRRSGPGDRERALQLLVEVADREPDHVDEAWLWRATLLMDEPTHRDEAARALERINPLRLKTDRVSLMAELHQRLDPTSQRALELFRLLAQQAMHRRKAVLTDLDADHSACEAQEAASSAARVLAQRGEAVAAFIELENVSGLRYLEALHPYHYRPADPVLNELWQHRLKLATQASYLATFAGNLRLMTVDAQREAAGGLATAFEDKVAKDPSFPHMGIGDPWLTSVLRGAVSASHPAEYVQALAEDRAEEAYQVIALLLERCPEAERERMMGSPFLDVAALERILAEQPGTVLVRLHQGQDLLAVAVWLKDGRVVGNASRANVPLNGWDLVAQAARTPERADPENWNALLASIDISSAFLPAPRQRIILLPSYLAAFLPLAALGPEGRRPLDLFASILWLPSLAPLMGRQVAHPPRRGTLTVLPGTTRFHALATGLLLPDERSIEGAAALPEEVASQARTADVICFYTHGFHSAAEEPYLKLHGKHQLDRSVLVNQWEGAERVELWACQSGVNAPLDPRNPIVDEAFGLDFEFLRVGVRSAIGTLWKVPDFVTACIVHRFRKELLAGRDAAEALAQAQRWWTGDGLRALTQHMSGAPRKEGYRNFIASLGADLAEEDLQDMLSSVPAARASTDVMSKAELALLHTVFASPLSWAGFRFVGVPEWRPLEAWTEEHERPASDEVKSKVERLLSSVERAGDPAPSVQDWLESALSSALAACEGRQPSAEEALAIARIYSARQVSARPHNLLLALEWLHERLASTGLAPEEDARLRTEAAHLWLDLAMGELPDLCLSSLHPPLPGPLLRAARLLSGDAPYEGPVLASFIAAKSRLVMVQELGHERRKPQVEPALRKAWQQLTPFLRGHREPGPETLRVLLTGCEMLLPMAEVDPKTGRELLRQCLATLKRSEDAPFTDVQKAPFLARLWEASGLLARALGRGTEGPVDAMRWLPPHELVRSTLSRLFPRIDDSVGDVTWFWGNVLAQMESALWGAPSDDRTVLVRSSGSPGFAYRWALSFYFSQMCLQGRPRDPYHFIACLQLACNLRVTFLHRLARHTSHPQLGMQCGKLWNTLRKHEDLLDQLRDEANATREPPPNRDTAPHAAREAETLREEAASLWRGISKSLPRQRDQQRKRVPLLELNTKLEVLEEDLARLPRGHGLLAITLGPGASPLVSVLWHGRQGRQGRVLHGQVPGLGGALAAVLQPYPEDEGPRAGSSAPRNRAWERLEKHLSAFLEQSLRAALNEPLHWAVLAPGAMRSLPWLGLPVGGKHRLYQRVASLRHLPCLGFDEPLPAPTPAARRVYLFVPSEEGDGASFGATAIKTLCGLTPPKLTLEPAWIEGRSVSEWERLQAVSHDVRSLRLYAANAPHFNLPLPGCEEVELWAANPSWKDAWHAGLDDADRIPGPAGDFLASGARAVLDLAWPVHDVVKALVCEQHGGARAEGNPGPAALCLAIQRTRSMLSHWARHARRSRSLREALALLDERRGASLAAHLPPSGVFPFADRHTAPALEGLTVDDLITELLHPSHLAAFRWWGN